MGPVIAFLETVGSAALKTALPAVASSSTPAQAIGALLGTVGKTAMSSGGSSPPAAPLPSSPAQIRQQPPSSPISSFNKRRPIDEEAIQMLLKRLGG